MRPRRSWIHHWNRRRGQYKFANYYQNRFLISQTSARHNDNYNRIKTVFFDWWIRIRTTTGNVRKRMNEFEYVYVHVFFHLFRARHFAKNYFIGAINRFHSIGFCLEIIRVFHKLSARSIMQNGRTLDFVFPHVFPLFRWSRYKSTGPIRTPYFRINIVSFFRFYNKRWQVAAINGTMRARAWRTLPRKNTRLYFTF